MKSNQISHEAPSDDQFTKSIEEDNTATEKQKFKEKRIIINEWETVDHSCCFGTELDWFEHLQGLIARLLSFVINSNDDPCKICSKRGIENGVDKNNQWAEVVFANIPFRKRQGNVEFLNKAMKHVADNPTSLVVVLTKYPPYGFDQVIKDTAAAIWDPPLLKKKFEGFEGKFNEFKPCPLNTNCTRKKNGMHSVQIPLALLFFAGNQKNCPRCYNGRLEGGSQTCDQCKKQLKNEASKKAWDKNRAKYLEVQRAYRNRANDTDYSCEDCKKMFSTRGNLVKHLKLHVGPKPFKCVQCQKRFSQNAHLKMHRRNIHSKSK